jgi:hypothetical protein
VTRAVRLLQVGSVDLTLWLRLYTMLFWRVLMLKLRIMALVAALASCSSSLALADCDLDQFVGMTLIAKKTIDGYIQSGERKDEFDGCDFDRTIVFSDQTGVACAGYSYSYAYRPTAFIWSDGTSMKMCVGSNVYAIKRIQ